MNKILKTICFLALAVVIGMVLHSTLKQRRVAAPAEVEQTPTAVDNTLRVKGLQGSL
jgi:cytochrome c-type biogenesis protein CcmE